MRFPSRGATLVSGTILLGAVLAGCSSASLTDPVFESEDVVAAPECADGRSCVEVRAPVVGSHEGSGSCALYGPGDPEALEPLAENDALEMRPGEITVWRVELDGSLEMSDLNPVCRPMIEG
jgi:hypothetical protein